MLSNYVLILITIYVVAESLGSLFQMGEGLKNLCHKAKYLMVIFTAVTYSYDIYLTTWLRAPVGEMCVIVTLALVVWPRMIWRLRCYGLIGLGSDANCCKNRDYKILRGKK